MKDLTGADKPVAPKRPRPNNRKNNNTMKTLLGLVAPVVSETVDGFQRDRVADRNAARAAAATTAPSTSHELPVGVSQPNNSINPGVGPNHYSPATGNVQMGGPGNQQVPGSSRLHSTLPSSMEALLERQWEQGSQFLMSQAQFDVAQLLSCLHQLKSENMRLEEQLLQLTRRREHLVALNQRLSVPLSGTSSLQNPSQQQSAQHSGPPQQISIAQIQPTSSMHQQQSGAGPSGPLVSPHHSPHIPSSSTDELLQMRSLASGRNAAALLAAAQQRPPSTAPPVSHSTANSSFTPVSSTSSAFVNRPSASAATNLSTSQQQPSTPSLSTDLSPERIAQLNQQLLFGASRPNSLLSGLTTNGGVDTTNLLLLLQNQLYSNSTSTASLLTRMMMNPLGVGGAAAPPTSTTNNPAAPLGGK
ncbi:hypothetical protein WR25_18963 [Diploscapter pachys]|uniref:Uncharacterized protein n=1 Tax=Diploscapter pachys TaxID=2018661 RepID=A0A2A2M0A6_9BILA|nr:hypothetical protein WR25_18963 [Diploscapter pachys]